MPPTTTQANVCITANLAQKYVMKRLNAGVRSRDVMISVRLCGKSQKHATMPLIYLWHYFQVSYCRLLTFEMLPICLVTYRFYHSLILPTYRTFTTRPSGHISDKGAMNNGNSSLFIKELSLQLSPKRLCTPCRGGKGQCPWSWMTLFPYLLHVMNSLSTPCYFCSYINMN